MIKLTKTYCLIALFLVMGMAFAQVNIPVTNAALQKINPSIHGLNLSSKAGVIFSSLNYGNGLTTENNYLYGNIAFPNQNFSVGIDVNSFKLNQLGLKENDLTLSYAYKLRFGFETYFIGGIDAGITSQLVDPAALIFQDQIDLQLGTIVNSSIDPLAQIKPSTNYFDFGASALIYSERFLVGLHLAHLNTPNVSFNKETLIEKEMAISVIGAFEIDVNPYGRGILPENSFFFGSIYGVLQGETTRVVSNQELQLSNFSFGLIESFVSYNQKSATELGILSSISFDSFLFNLTYTFQTKTETFFVPSIFELGLRFDFDRFTRNRRGYYKKLNTDNL